MKQVYIVHGYTASPDSHWFPYLEKALKAQGIACHRLTMPTPCTPQVEQWVAHLKYNVTFTPDTVFIGHSLGCVTILNFLAEMQKTVRGAIFVSGFYEPIPHLPELDGFCQQFDRLQTQGHTLRLFAHKPWVISARDDAVVPPSYSDNLAELLDANYVRFHQGGHFLDRQGWFEFPFVLQTLEQIFA